MQHDDDFQAAFWATKRAIALAAEAAYNRHGVRSGQQFILRCLWYRDGQTPGEVLGKLEKIGRLSIASSPTPPRPGSFCVYVERRWRLLELAESSIDRRDALRSLDVALLQERVLAPVLGIGDPRTDKRIDFVGGLRGAGELEARVDTGAAALAVSLYPTTVEQLMAVSDAGEVMPPKSTWFEPKLASGLFVHTTDYHARQG